MSSPSQALLEILQLTRNGKTIPLDQFMSIALMHYYSSSQVFGESGDFITSPEISQMFGECIGIWCMLIIQKLSLKKFSLVEIGPGRGLLTKDLLRATKGNKSFNEKLEKIYLIETSQKLIDIQKINISDSRVCWVKYIDEVPTGNLIIIANEFFDALPIKQFKKTKNGWKEIVIAAEPPGLKFQEADIAMQFTQKVPIGGVIEIATDMEEYAALIAAKISSGAFLTIDYGYLKSNFVSTLQAVKAHKFHPVLKDVGLADLTSHINFSALSSIFNHVQFSTQITNQNEFLSSHGIMHRAEQLIKEGANPVNIASQIIRLTSVEQMGTLFKVLQAIKK